MANGLDLLFDPAVQAALPAICEKYGIARLEAFGSVVRDDFGPESDVDLLFTPVEGHEPKLKSIIHAEFELGALFQRSVDLVHRPRMMNHWNYIFRRNALSEERPIYDASTN